MVMLPSPFVIPRPPVTGIVPQIPQQLINVPTQQIPLMPITPPPLALPQERVPIRETKPEDLITRSVDGPDAGQESNDIFFHGTKSGISSLEKADPVQFGQVSAIYGEGLYLTDNKNIAESYSKRKGSGPQGKVLSGRVDKNVPLLDLDKEIPDNVKPIFQQIIGNYTDEIPTSWKGADVYEFLREAMADNEITESEAIEDFQQLNNQLWGAGIKGLKHVGGRKTKSPFGEHNVKILFQDPFTLKIDAIKDVIQSKDKEEIQLTRPSHFQTGVQVPRTIIKGNHNRRD